VQTTTQHSVAKLTTIMRCASCHRSTQCQRKLIHVIHCRYARRRDDALSSESYHRATYEQQGKGVNARIRKKVVSILHNTLHKHDTHDTHDS
jgi:hypothetical protein